MNWNSTAGRPLSSEKRADLVLAVFAPEDSQGPTQVTPLPPLQRLLLYSNVPRRNAGDIEAYVLRIARAQLDRLGIPYGSSPSRSEKLTDSVIQAWASRDAAKRQVAPRIAQDLARNRAVMKQAKAVFRSLSSVPASMKQNRLFVPRGASLDPAQAEAIDQGMRNVRHYSTVMNLRLTEEELGRLGLEVSAGRVDGNVDIGTLLSLFAGRTGQSLERVRSLVDACRDQRLLADAFRPPANGAPPPPPPPPGSVEATPEAEVLSRILGQLRDLEKADPDALPRRPDVQAVQGDVQSLELKGGPADVPAFHDFTVLQIAFKHVWTEAFDETMRAMAEGLYAEAVRLADDYGVDTPMADAINDVDQLREFVADLRGDHQNLSLQNPVPPVLVPGYRT